jgi:hypothetical protein
MIFVPLVSLLTCAVALFPQLPLRDPEAPRPGEPEVVNDFETPIGFN